MNSPRTPRQDAEALRAEIRDVLGEAPTCEHGSKAGTYCWPCAQRDRGAELAAYAAPLSEVLPETPEPPRPECECFVVPEEQWTRHYDATEPGSMVEPNPDCQVHFPASQSVPAVPVSSTGGKETGEAAETATEELRDALADLLDAAMERNQGASLDSIEAWDFDTDLLPIADAILAAGWRPPLPAAQVEIDDEADAWYVRILDVDVHHTTESAPVNLDWTRDGQLIGVELLGPLKRTPSSPDRELCASVARLARGSR